MAVHLALLAGLLAADAAVLVGVAPGWTARAADAELAAATLPAPAAGGRSVSSKTVPPPVEVVVPRLGIRSRLVGLRLQRDGSLSVPADFDRAGWWTQGAAPGEKGPAVLAGHVDSKKGPAVFFRLNEARRGDVVRVRRADGRVLAYQIFKINNYPKDRFPTDEVYSGRFGDGLRLITCAGSFNEKRGSYRDNLVVYARPFDEGGAAAKAEAARAAAAKAVYDARVGREAAILAAGGPPAEALKAAKAAVAAKQAATKAAAVKAAAAKAAAVEAARAEAVQADRARRAAAAKAAAAAPGPRRR